MPRAPERDLEVAEAGVDRRPVRAGERRDLATRQRLLGDEQERLEGGLGQLDGAPASGRRCAPGSTASSAASIASVGSIRALTRTTPVISSSGASAIGGVDTGGGALLGRGRAGDDRAPRLGLLDDDLAPLHELEHGQERDGDDDPVADARPAGPGGRRSARRAGQRG